MKTLKDIYEDYADEPGLPFEIFKMRLYDFLLDLDEAEILMQIVLFNEIIY